MTKFDYKSTIDNIKISDDFNENTLEFLSKKGVNNKRKKIWFLKNKYCFPLIAACILFIFVLYPILTNNSIPLKNSIGNVSVKYVNEFPKFAINYDLVFLSEEAIFSKYNTSIFKGELIDIKNIKINIENSSNYNSIAKIKLIESYRGNEKPGDIIEVLIPCPIDSKVWVEDTGVISKARIGTVGIFMPLKYDETSIWKENNTTLYLRDICQYGFLDGERFAFLETNNGISYGDFAYESIPKNPTLEDIKKYVIKMIK